LLAWQTRHEPVLEPQPEQRRLAWALQAQQQVSPLQELAQVPDEPKSEPAVQGQPGQVLQRAAGASVGQMLEAAHSCQVAWKLGQDIQQLREYQRQVEDIEQAVRKTRAADN